MLGEGCHQRHGLAHGHRGNGGQQVQPDRDISRAEFAASIVHGLGLKPESGSTSYSDVKATDWYDSAIQTAYAYGLINGYDDGTFRSNERITREQAMAIIAKAMKLTVYGTNSLRNRRKKRFVRSRCDCGSDMGEERRC